MKEWHVGLDFDQVLNKKLRTANNPIIFHKKPCEFQETALILGWVSINK